MPPLKSPMKYAVGDSPVIGQNATSIQQLLDELQEEYLYNTRVVSHGVEVTQNLLRTARKASMRAAKRQLDVASPQPPPTKPCEAESGQYIRFTIEVLPLIPLLIRSTIIIIIQ
jgi:hypothetical protein